ncbi:MAG: glycosyltransferase family 2 protein [Vicinamibacterales bacterium]
MTVEPPDIVPPTTKPATIAAVVVTYNRLALLQECVAALRAQTRPPDEIVVVDNGSTDGTADWLAAQPGLTVVTQANLGSGGGQHTGVRIAYLKGCDWFWCMDDDTIPEPDALRALTVVPHFSEPTTGTLSSLVLDTAGRLFGSSWLMPHESARWADTILHDRCLEVSVATFVSLLVRRAAVTAVGLPVKEFFLGVDDWEFTARIGRRFRNYCVLDSRVIHKAPNRQLPPAEHARTRKYLHGVMNQAAWVRLQPVGWVRKATRLAYQFLILTRLVASGMAPLRALHWFAKGLTMRVRIEFP